MGHNYRIYNIFGQYIDDFAYEMDEEIIMEFDNINSFVVPDWTLFSYSEERLDGGKGKFILTDTRVIFYCNIDPMKKFQGGPLIPMSLIDMWTAKSQRNRGLKEFYEFDIEEIHHSKKGWGKNKTVYILAYNEKKFQVCYPKLKNEQVREFIDQYLVE